VTDAGLITAAYVVAHAVTTPTAAGRRVTLVPAVAAAGALMSGGSAVLVLATAGLALPFGRLIVHVLHGSRTAAHVFPAEPMTVAVLGGTVAAGALVVPTTSARDPLMLGLVAIAAVMAFGAGVAVRGVTAGERRVVSRRLVVRRAVGEWPAHAAQFAAAALLAVTADEMGIWSVALAGLPYGFSHMALRWLEHTRATYDQTIRSLGAIPEAADQVANGHSTRTADLAVAVGAELGMSARDLRTVEYAALLHDIGRVVMANPAVTADEYTFADVSEWSAAIIGEVRFLEGVAAVVSLQHAPYRRAGERNDTSVPRSSQVIRVAARYDSSTSDGVSPVEAMERLHRGAAYDYDPEVVMALRRVLERRRQLAA
jgi:hypothetical protein